MTLTAPGASTPARVADISLSGVRCHTDQEVDVMTQVGMQLVLPGARTIDCRGAVVRSRRLDGGAEGYETAIFFTSMAERDRVELQQFLQDMREGLADGPARD